MAKVGRPRKNSNIIEIISVRLEYISTKEDNYENKITYLKLIDNAKKLKPILDQMCDECRLPLWKTETDEYILKCKDKFMPKHSFDANDIFTADLQFKYYCITTDEKLLQGYFLKVLLNDNTDIEN